MQKFLRIAAYVIGALVALIVVAAAWVFTTSSSRLSRVYDVPEERLAAFEIPTDEASIAEGQRLATGFGCMSCHSGGDGGEFANDPAFGVIYAPNLTNGEGGAASFYEPEDWVASVRYGLLDDGRSMFLMPAEHYTQLTDEDLGLIVAYLESLPPVDTAYPERQFGPLCRTLIAAGEIYAQAEAINYDIQPAASIDHETVSRELGAYFAIGCTGCHGPNYAGGAPPGEPPDAPQAPNITFSDEGIGDWTEEQFITAMRTGVTPDNRQLDPERMPWPEFSVLNDAELTSIYNYLREQPTLPDNP